jgi:benzoate-CoA ligase family protein
VSFEPPERFNIADYFLGDRLQEGLGERVALRLPDGTGRTYADVERAAARWANALVDLGVRREDRVVVALPDGPAFVGAFFGILKAGAVVVMVNPDLAPETLAPILAYARPARAVVAAGAVAAYEAAATAGTPVELLVTDAPGTGDHEAAGRHPRFADLEPSAAFPTVQTHRDDPAIWLFSGGTTGRPKAVVQPHRSFANTTECYAKAAVGYTAADLTLSVPKLYFGYATGANLLFPFAVGGATLLFPERPTADLLFRLIAEHRPTILVNVPKLIGEMLEHPAAGAEDLSCLRFALSAGEALPAGLFHRWRETFGVDLLDGLGTAEMWHIFCSNLPGATRPGTVGRPVPGFTLAVRDDDGRDVPDGEVGRLWVRGDSRALLYWQNLPATAEAFHGPWYASSDMVRRDADGYVTYIGRADDALKVGGKWLLPAEVEGCLAEHPSVAECAVVGVPDAAGLTKPVAFVVPDSGRAPADLEDALKEHVLAALDAYKHPRRVFVVDALPRTHLGKVDRGRLRARAGTAP